MFSLAKPKSTLEESVFTEQHAPSPILPADDDIPEPWRSVIRDLSSKVDTLKIKRQDDRMKIKEGEKNKLQVLRVVSNPAQPKLIIPGYL